MILAMDTDKLVQNSAFTVMARLAMIACAAILPVAGTIGLFMMQRVISAADEIGAKVDKGAVQMQLLQQEVKYGFDAAKSDISGLRIQLTDHEGRLRVIERDPGRARTPN